MDKDLKKSIEQVFRTATESNQLFDHFEIALSNKIKDVDLYKTLLGNPILTFDEIKMYCSKLCETFPKSAYDYFIWSAAIFENSGSKLDAIENAIVYYKYAAMVKPDECEPYLRLCSNYNYDVDVSSNREILLTLNDGIKYVSERSTIFTKLAEIYKKKDMHEISEKYCAMAAEAKREERKLRNNNQS